MYSVVDCHNPVRAVLLSGHGKLLLLRDAKFDGPLFSPRAPSTGNRSSRSLHRDPSLPILDVQVKILTGSTPPLLDFQVSVIGEALLIKTLDFAAMNSVAPVTSSVVGLERNALDGCCGLPSEHNNGLAQQALVVAGN
ncbi:hypothetical protein Peur_032086 [Populus x canadensis]